MFTVPITQVAITGNNEHWVLPANTINNSSKRIEFFIPPMQDLIDPNSIWFHIEFKIRKRTAAVENLGSTTTSGATSYDFVQPAPYFGNTMFKEVEVIMGNSTRITPQSSPYHYKAFFDTLFFSTREAKKTYLRGALWMSDDDRYNAIKSSATVSVMGRLHVDLFMQEKLLLPLIPMRINLTLNPELVMFMSKAGTGKLAVANPVLELLDCKLCMRKFSIDNEVHNGIDKGLSTADAKYFITRGVVDTRHIPSGVTHHTVDNVFKGILPRLFIVGFIKNEDFNGKIDTDAFQFEPHGLKSIAAYKGSTMLNGRPYTPDFTNKNYTREYVDLYRALCQDTTEPMMDITYDDFKDKYCFFAFNLSPDASNSGADNGIVNSLTSDTIRVELTWNSALTSPLNMITYALYDNHISISIDREVKHDF